jgi:inner membrane protein
MDNIAHALVGAALGRAVADRKVPAAALLGAFAGNVPDVAELFVAPDAWTPRAGVSYLVFHRGITHSLLGAALEIVVLTTVIGAFLIWRARRRREVAPGWPWIAACIATTVLSHVYLDWQGSYGLRPLLPWSARWYYADWVAIVDPFFWVVPVMALAWGARRHWAPALAFLVALVALVALLLWRHDIVAGWVRLTVLVAAFVAVVGWSRHWFGVAGRRRAAAAGVLVLVGYAAAGALVSATAKLAAHRAALARFGPRAQWAALTIIGRPFQWEVLTASADSVAGPSWTVPRHLDHAAVRAALATPQGRAIGQFARFLAADIDSSGSGVRVTLWDVGYHRPGAGTAGWAAVQVRLR